MLLASRHASASMPVLVQRIARLGNCSSAPRFVAFCAHECAGSCYRRAAFRSGCLHANESFAPGGRRFGQDSGGNCRASPRSRKRCPGCLDGADSNSRRAALHRPPTLARTAGRFGRPRTAARKEDPLILFSATNARSAGTAQIFVGTHALLYEPEGLDNPGLVVIDEQHKFGVAQRSRLTSREPPPDVLVMTATPIPRTLTMSLYGDLDVSTIDEMPAQRGKIITAARDPRSCRKC